MHSKVSPWLHAFTEIWWFKKHSFFYFWQLSYPSVQGYLLLSQIGPCLLRYMVCGHFKSRNQVMSQSHLLHQFYSFIKQRSDCSPRSHRQREQTDFSFGCLGHTELLPLKLRLSLTCKCLFLMQWALQKQRRSFFLLLMLTSEQFDHLCM